MVLVRAVSNDVQYFTKPVSTPCATGKISPARVFSPITQGASEDARANPNVTHSGHECGSVRSTCLTFGASLTSGAAPEQ